MSDEAEQIAARVPLPEPVFHGVARGGMLREDCYTADQLRAYGLACVREAMRGGVAVAWAWVEDGEVLDLSFTENNDAGCVTPLYTAPPAGRVEVSDAMVERAARAAATNFGQAFDDLPAEVREHMLETQRAAITAASNSAGAQSMNTKETKPETGGDVLAAYDDSVAEQIKRISTVPYNSKEICTHFAGELRKAFADRIERAHARESAAQVGVPSEMRWFPRPDYSEEARVAGRAYADGWNACRAAMLSAAPAPTAEPEPKPAPSDALADAHRRLCEYGREMIASDMRAEAPASPQAAQGDVEALAQRLSDYAEADDLSPQERADLYAAARILGSPQPATAKLLHTTLERP